MIQVVKNKMVVKRKLCYMVALFHPAEVLMLLNTF